MPEQHLDLANVQAIFKPSRRTLVPQVVPMEIQFFQLRFAAVGQASSPLHVLWLHSVGNELRFTPQPIKVADQRISGAWLQKDCAVARRSMVSGILCIAMVIRAPLMSVPDPIIRSAQFSDTTALTTTPGRNFRGV
jgi:hypothetical protein